MKKLWVCLMMAGLAACGHQESGTNASAPQSAQDLAAANASTPPVKVRVDAKRSSLVITAMAADLSVDDIVINEGECKLFGQSPADLKAFDPNTDEGRATGLPADMLTQGKADLLAQLPPFKLRMGEERVLQYEPCNPVEVQFKTNHGAYTARAG